MSQSPDYAGAINALGFSAPDGLTGLLATVVAPLGGRQVVVYLADFAQTVLQPLLLTAGWDGQDWAGDAEAVGEQDVATTMAGRCFAPARC